MIKLLSEIKIIPGGFSREETAELFQRLFVLDIDTNGKYKGLGTDLYNLRHSFEEYHNSEIGMTVLIMDEKLFSISQVKKVWIKLNNIKNKYNIK
jgi:hypothetical protein